MIKACDASANDDGIKSSFVFVVHCLTRMTVCCAALIDAKRSASRSLQRGLCAVVYTVMAIDYTQCVTGASSECASVTSSIHNVKITANGTHYAEHFQCVPPNHAPARTAVEPMSQQAGQPPQQRFVHECGCRAIHVDLDVRLYRASLRAPGRENSQIDPYLRHCPALPQRARKQPRGSAQPRSQQHSIWTPTP